MPKISLVLGRRTIKVYDLAGPTIRVGRSDQMDIMIDNVSVSREHAHIVQAGQGWVVRDMGSSNGTFVAGQRLQGDHALRSGDEISIGKFSLFWDKVVVSTEGEPTTAEPKAATASGTHPTLKSSGPATGSVSASAAVSSGTMVFKPKDLEQMLKSSAEARRAHVVWKSGGKQGEYILPESGCALVGQTDLCDLQVPAGPKHHLLITRSADGYQVRNLSTWTKMKVNREVTKRARLADGTRVEMAGLELKFVAEIGGKAP